MPKFCEQTWDLKHYTIFLDVDGTLVGDGGRHIDLRTKQILDHLQKNNQIILCSNSPKKARTQKLATSLKVDWNPGPYKKPDKAILKTVPLKYRKCAVIGNLYCIDGRFAKAIGAEFFPVKTTVGLNEHFWDQIFYWIDAHIFSKCI